VSLVAMMRTSFCCDSQSWQCKSDFPVM